MRRALPRVVQRGLDAPMAALYAIIASVRSAPRLRVLLAQEAPVGVVFRRGPKNLVRLVMWDRETDTFQPGQWFRGKLYAEQSDVSPDGRHLIYLAMGGLAWVIPATGGTWTAISVLPSLTAVALWGQDDTWGGGGMFLSSSSFWLDADANTFLIRDNSGLRRETYGPHLPFRSRLERDGWVLKPSATPWTRRIFEKTIRQEWILRRLPEKRGYELEHTEQGTRSFPAWEWAEQDRDRLVWAEAGCLRAATLGSDPRCSFQTLFDFNDMVPPAPAGNRRKE